MPSDTSETRTCQSCQNDFAIDAEDFGFYEMIKVPPPTWCPECRLLRRMNWISYRILYKRKCDFTGENIITFYHPDVPCKIYKQDVWWGDKWDPKSYGRGYDFSRPFFEQYKELLEEVPRAALHTSYTTLTNSEYCNAVSFLKNGYLCFRHITGEDNAYTNFVLKVSNCQDISFTINSDFCYETVDVGQSFQTFFSQDCHSCQNVYFSRDLVNCSNCFGCTSLRNKSYCIFNEQFTKEEYENKLKEFNFGSNKNLVVIKKRAEDFSLKFPRRAGRIVNGVNVSGEYIYNSRNAHDVYHVADSENIRYSGLFVQGGIKNSYDYTYFGQSSELIYESSWIGRNAYNAKFGVWNYSNRDTEYTFGCHASSSIFGCSGMNKAEYCILNKQYTKEAYEEIVPRIKKHMDEMPFVDRIGRRHGYGGQIPVDLCPWAYNESTAFEFFPITKDEALAKGFTWRDPDPREYMDATVEVPDHIENVNEDILKAILKCEECGKNYQIISKELVFLKRFGLPIPRHCPLCRDRARVKQMNPMQIYIRSCDKCKATTETSYAPDRPEIVYCESCYKQEVY